MQMVRSAVKMYSMLLPTGIVCLFIGKCTILAVIVMSRIKILEAYANNDTTFT